MRYIGFAGVARTRLAALAALAVLAAPSAGRAETLAPAVPERHFAGRAPLCDDELAQIRGGFTVNGVDVTLGVQMETYLNGQLVLVTTANWTAAGATTTTTAAPSLVQASAAVQHALLAGGSLGNGIASAQVYLANGGQTAIWQSVANGIQNGLLNTANGVQATQTLNATIGIAGYAAFAAANQSSLLSQSLGASIGSMIGR